MTSDLLRAVERLLADANKHSLDHAECIGGTLGRQRSKKQGKGDAQALKKELEKDFLTPQTSFDAGWLNKIQQYVTQPRKVEVC